jgi:hypothetical protein
VSFEKLTIPGLSDDEGAVVNGLLKQLDDKSERNLLRASYYDGKRAIRQVGSVIPPQYYRLGMVLGWTGKAVDTLARRTNPDQITWADGDLDALGVREVNEANDLMAELKGGLVSSLIHGTSFLITTRGDVNAGEAPALLHVKDAMNCTGDWNARRRRLDDVVSVTKRSDDGRKVTGLVLYRDGLTITADYADAQWTVDRQEHPWGVPVERLAYKPRPGRPFGSSRISRSLMSLHDQGLREIIRLEGHMDIYSYPEMWMLGADESIFKNADGTQKASWQIVLGRVKGIPDDEDATNPRADVKQFPASSPEPHLAALNAFSKMFAREANLPDSSVAITDVANPTSAEAYDASQHDLIADAEGAVDDWTPPIRRTVARLLAIQNGYSEVPEAWSSMGFKFRKPQHTSRAAEADAGTKQLAAVPWLAETRVGLELLGLTSQQIDDAMAERRRAAGRDLLRTLGGTNGPDAA